METLNILLISIRLLFLERLDFEKSTNDSRDDILDMITHINNVSKSFKSKSSTKVENLITFVKEFIELFEEDVYDISFIKQHLHDILDDDERRINDLIDSIKGSSETSEEERMSRILRLRNLVRTHTKKLLLKELSMRLQRDTSNNFKGIGNVSEYANNTITVLEEIGGGDIEQDINIKSSFSLGDDESTSEIIEKVKEEQGNGFLLKTGFQRLNKALDGGFRRGELAMVASREGGYKSGFTRSTFIQILTENTPVVQTEGKKPLSIIYSFEDGERIVLKFLYEYFKSCEGKTEKINEVSSPEAAKYIKEQALKNGWELEIFIVDPSNWGFRDVFNSIELFESKGYEVIAVLLDYLSLLNKKGCKGTGTTGSETRELFRRIGNYGRSKDIFMYTPHQSSSAVKSLLDNGVKEGEILKEIYGRSYFADSRQISQELDVSILTYPVMHEDSKYLHVAVDKHRGYVLDYKKCFWFYKFPKKDMPIPKDTHTEDKGLNSLGYGNDNLF